MTQLPLFPLNTVLFPGTPLSLHIFEERYKLMIGRCIEANQAFGIVLLKRGSEVMGMRGVAEPWSIGCSAQITQVQALDGGRMNITAVGLERFQISSIQRDQPYLVGDIEPYPLKIEHPEAIRRSARRLRPWIERYIDILEEAEKVQFDFKRLPHDSLALTYHAAALLKTELSQKQALLSISDGLILVESVYAQYRKEVTLLKALLLQPQQEYAGPFSLN